MNNQSNGMKMKLKRQTLMVLCLYVMSTVGEDYENKLTKLWSLSKRSNSDGSAVVNVTSASIVVQPSTNYADQNTAKATKNVKYAFRPRAIPLKKDEQRSQDDNSVYYSQDNVNKYKTEILFPGNYVPIANEKSRQNTPKYNIHGLSGLFETKTIPLIRNDEFQKRSFDMVGQPIIEEPEEILEPTASRRSLSYMFGAEDDDDDLDDEDEGEYEVEETDGTMEKELKTKAKKNKKRIKQKKLKKYMLPLLLAYKMKYFALVPVMIGGLVLLVGATGLAGFFFALFAAVMGLQKDSY